MTLTVGYGIMQSLGGPPKIDSPEFCRADGDLAFYRVTSESCDDLIIARR